MTKNKITFKDLQTITEQLVKGNDSFFLEYINSFGGDTTYDKFMNILNCWNIDVSPTMNFNRDGKDIKMNVSYIMDQLKTTDINEPMFVSFDPYKVELSIPKKFKISDVIPIYDIIRTISIHNTVINIDKLKEEDKQIILDSLPPKLYNVIIKHISEYKDKILSFDDLLFADIKLNFLTVDSVVFLRRLFSSYGEDYFRDVIYHLSEKIDGNVLMNSTLQDIDYYTKKLTSEIETKNNHLKL
jgi:hypothetical protein